MEKIRNKLERFISPIAVPNLILYIVVGMVVVFLVDLLAPGMGKVPLSPYIQFDRDSILHGQVWRILTFVFQYPASSTLFIVFAFYMYWLFGSALESHWGTSKFCLFYYAGIIGAIIAGFITGDASNTFLDISMTIAFAIFDPDFTIMLFFFIPVKIKYIAYVTGAILVVLFIMGSLSVKISILFSLINLLLFFGDDLFLKIKYTANHYKYKLKNKNKNIKKTK